MMLPRQKHIHPLFARMNHLQNRGRQNKSGRRITCQILFYQHNVIKYATAAWAEITGYSIKKIKPSLKVLLSSGYSEDGEATEILNRGCDGFI